MRHSWGSCAMASRALCHSTHHPLFLSLLLPAAQHGACARQLSRNLPCAAPSHKPIPSTRPPLPQGHHRAHSCVHDQQARLPHPLAAAPGVFDGHDAAGGAGGRSMRSRARRAMLWRRHAPDLQPHVGCRGEARGPLSGPAAGPLLTGSPAFTATPPPSPPSRASSPAALGGFTLPSHRLLHPQLTTPLCLPTTP